MTLSIYVAQEMWPEFDDAWKGMMASEAPVDEVISALKLAGERKRITRCVPFVKEHVVLLEAGDRPGDGARLLGAALIAGGNPPELTDDLVRLATSAWSKEAWWLPYKDLAGLEEGAPDLRTPWRTFAKMQSFQEGTLVYHPGGWGTGEVTEVIPASLEIDVQFASGKKDRFPMNAAIDIFEPLIETDLRAQNFRDPEGLRKGAKKEPLTVLKTIVNGQSGKATTSQIRIAMMGIGVEGSAWSAWWRKARKQAENSEWFEVTGTPAKSIVTLLLTAKDPSAALRKTLEHAAGVAEAHAKVRDLLMGTTKEDPLVAVALEILGERVLQEGEPLQERIAAWLLLAEQEEGMPDAMIELLGEVAAVPNEADLSTPSELWKLFQALPSLKDQERSTRTLPYLYGEEWLDAVRPNLQHASPGMVRPLVDAFVTAERQADLLETYAGLLARPLRAPSLLVHLAGMFETGEPLGKRFPTGTQRAQALISLAANLFKRRRGNPQLTRVSTRLSDTLTKGAEPVMRHLLADSDATGLRSLTVICARGVESDIDRMVTGIALDLDRQFFAGNLGPFWEGDTIWTTKAGLERRSAELRELQDVKIPENADAIGRAASFGDLSENAEWEAALEEQRNLTTRAMEIEEELRNADLLENAMIPEDTICPGTSVKYRETDSGTKATIAILGPWDGDKAQGLQVVSYRAPLAAGLLGLHTADQATLQLPSGTLDIEVLEIGIIDV
ncbi:MAG: transcription elongation factor GreA [Planctomycetota bacterium]|jgi:transcription elongation factor GreA